MIRKILFVMVCLVAAAVIGILALYCYNTRVTESEEALASAPATTKFLDVGSEKFAYSEVDNHALTTVVFVGGLSAWNGTWERVVREVNDERKDLNYIALDLPPFGYSVPNSEKTYYRNVQAERLTSFVKNKNITNVILVGHSYGAGPSIEYAMRNQGVVKKLVLIDAVLNIDETKKISKYSPVQLGFLRDVLIGVLIHNDSFALSRLKTFVYITDHVDQGLLDIYTRYFNTDNTTKRLSSWLRDYVNDPLNYLSNTSENYKKISFPVRLIWGDKDTITPIEGTMILLETVPDINLATLKNVGHIPMIEDYAQFDAALLDALSE